LGAAGWVNDRWVRDGAGRDARWIGGSGWGRRVDGDAEHRVFSLLSHPKCEVCTPPSSILLIHSLILCEVILWLKVILYDKFLES
jgi:hypothetical protein